MSGAELLAPNLLSRPEWAEQIRASWNQTRESVIETGRRLIAAKGELPHGQFEAMVEADLPFKPRTAQMLMRVAECPRLTNPKHASLLPASWYTLYELTKLLAARFNELIENGDAIPLAVERRYDFSEFGGYLGNVGSIIGHQGH